MVTFRKRRATQTVKISASTRGQRTGDTLCGARDNATLCLTPQNQGAHNGRRMPRASCGLLLVWSVHGLAAHADAGVSGSPWHQGHMRSLCNGPETIKLKVSQARCGGASHAPESEEGGRSLKAVWVSDTGTWRLIWAT